MGKPGENQGDSLDGFDPDLDENDIDAHLTDPLGTNPNDILGKATTRLVYDPSQSNSSTIRTTTRSSMNCVLRS